MMIPGEKGKSHYQVGVGDTATLWGGRFEVLASPVLIGKIENACMKTTDHFLGAGQFTVGLAFEIEHRAPTPVGATVEFEVELVGVNANKLKFAVVARDEFGLVAKGTHLRAIVDEESFRERLNKRKTAEQTI